MSPKEFKEKAIVLSGDTRVTTTFHTLFLAACFLLGFRYMPNSSVDERKSGEQTADGDSDVLIYKMDLMLSSQSGVNKKLHDLEIEVNKQGGTIGRNREDIVEMQRIIGRSSGWPGAMESD